MNVLLIFRVVIEFFWRTWNNWNFKQNFFEDHFWMFSGLFFKNHLWFLWGISPTTFREFSQNYIFFQEFIWNFSEIILGTIHNFFSGIFWRTTLYFFSGYFKEIFFWRANSRFSEDFFKVKKLIEAAKVSLYRRNTQWRHASARL